MIAAACFLFLILLFLAALEYNIETLKLSTLDGRLDQELEGAKNDAATQDVTNLNVTTTETAITDDPARRRLKEVLCKRRKLH